MNISSTLVPESEYTSDYFLKHCGGYDRFSFDGYTIGYAHKRCFDLADIKSHDQVLDLGCGRGELMYEARKQGAIVYGTDYASSSIQIVRKYLMKNQIEGITVAQATLPEIPFEGITFSKIFFLDVIEHIYEPVVQATLDNIKKVCSPGAKLIIHTDNKYFQEFTIPVVNVVRKYLLRHRIPVDEHAKLHVNYQSLNGLVKKLKSRGFVMDHADYIYPTSYLDLTPWTSIKHPVILKGVFGFLKLVLKTPFKHLLCPTFDIKCTKH